MPDRVFTIDDVTDCWETREDDQAELNALRQLQEFSALVVRDDLNGELHPAIVATAAAIMGADMASMQMLDDAAGGLRLLASRGFHPASVAHWGRVPLASVTSCGTAATGAARVVVPDVEKCPALEGTADLAEFRRSGVRSCQSTPLISRTGRVLGVVSTHWRQPHAPSERDLRLLDLLARQAADIIEQARVVASLHESEERLRTSQEVANVGSFDLDLTTGLNLWSPKLEALHGLPEGGFAKTQHSWESLLHPDDRGMALGKVRETLDSGKPVEAEWRVVWPDGSVHWLFGRFQAFMNEAGKAVRLTGVNIDITERKQTMDALRATEAFQRSIIVSSPDCIKVLDLAGRLLSMEIGQKLLGIDEVAPLLGTSWIDFWEVASDRAAARAAVEKAAAGGEGKFVGFFRTLRGEDKWWDVVVTPILNAEGRPARLLAVSRDVTEAKQAGDNLRESEARKEAILSSALDAIITMDHAGRLVEFNPAAERIFGHSRAEVIGKLLSEVILPERLREEHWRGLAQYLATGEGPALNQQIELPALRADGTEFPAEFAIIPIPGSQPPMFTAFLRDVTSHRHLEDSLVARAEELARADRRKDEFLAMLAHELRNPLAPLRNASEILKTAGTSEEERAQAQSIICRQIENMSRMIDDLLDVSRITEGKIALRREAVSIEAILTAAASLARSNCAARQQVLTVTLPAEPVFVHADATRLEQVFGNLLGNACKYSGEGSCISFSAERDDAQVVVRVSDNGAGIAPELLPRVFDLFVQASSALDRAHGGLGIGLTLVQRLVKLHGGTVEVRSEGLGKGSEFIVRLPILREAPAPAPLPAIAPLTTVPSMPRRILIVDDNRDSARTLAVLQTRRGHVTCTAFTGPEALTAAQEFLPDVMLLDIGLPGMDGLEVARKIRALPAMAQPFLVAMSGYGRDEDRAEAKLAGFNEYIVKPVDLELLGRWLQRL